MDPASAERTRLLVAVDLADDPESTVRAAARWAERMGARLDLLYAIGRGASADPLGQAGDLDAQRAVMLQTRLDALTWIVPADHRGAAVLDARSPLDALLARGGDYDAVLVHPTRKTGLQRLLAGSVTGQVVRATPSTVIVLPPSGV